MTSTAVLLVGTVNAIPVYLVVRSRAIQMLIYFLENYLKSNTKLVSCIFKLSLIPHNGPHLGNTSRTNLCLNRS